MAANVAIPLEQPQIKVAPPPAAGSPGSWLWTPEYVGSRVFASGPAMPTNDNSWEARAFMEDSNSLEAGIWPPRSYRCSFCRREFRCAQALGGHMNVHRRDRARLRQSSPLLGSDSDSASALTPLPVSAPAASADADHAQKLGLLHPISTDSLYKLMSFAVPITTFLSTPSLISTSSTSSILASAPVLPASNYQHPDGVSSLPLRLQRLASEAASTQSERSHFFSLGPPPTWPISHIANSVNVPIAATPASSSATSPPSIATTTRCRRQASLNQLKSESPRKKSAASGFQPYELSINKNSSQPANTADNAQLHTTERLNLVDNSHSELNDSNAAGGLDLELRLGQTSA